MSEPLWDDDAIESLLTTLSEGGPLGADELLNRADRREEMTATAEDVADVLADQPGVYELPDERWVWLPSLLEGRVFTHRLVDVEVQHDLLIIDVDLFAPLMLSELPDFQHLADGSRVGDVSPALNPEMLTARGVPPESLDVEGVLLLGTGHLADLGVGVGELIAVRVTAAGFALSPVGDVPPSPAVPGIVGMATADPEQPVDLVDAVLQLCADDDDLLREPSAPLGESLRAAGLVHDGDLIAAEGFDFAQARAGDALERLREQYDLDEDEAAAVAIIVGRCDDIAHVLDDSAAGEEAEVLGDGWPLVSGAPGSPDDEQRERDAVAASIDLLAVPEVAEAVRWELDPSDARSSAALGMFAQAAEPQSPRGSRAALRYLQGVAQERLGDVADAEATFGAAESLDPSWPPTLLRLAQYAGDRGDAERALGLLHRAGLDADHPSITVLAPFRPVAHPELGRNQPCWCGSGRKYKACHLHHREQLPLADRAIWLHHKAAAVLPEWAGPLMVELAVVRSEDQPGDDAVVQAMDDPLIADVLLAEGTRFFRFLEARGHLLPDDERELARQWLGVPRSVHEVVSVATGSGAQLEDLRTGEVHDVSRWSADRSLRVGERYCARVLPVGDTWQIPGSLEPVAPGTSPDLLDRLGDEPAPLDVVRVLSQGARR